jgi:uncharacterized protein YndB with AHSA1/START domain
MNDAVAQKSRTAAPELTLERNLHYPPEEVFKAWTDQAALRQWMGPGKICAPNAKMDARVGGAYVFPMQRPDGTVSTVRGVIRELIPNRKLRFTWGWDEDDGSKGHDTEVTLEFHPTSTGTRLVLRHTNFMSDESRDKHEHGWNGCTDSLEAYLAGKLVACS